MSGNPVLIENWITQGMKWVHVTQISIKSFDILAGQTIQIPNEKYTFNYPEGVILVYDAFFDHPKCGIRIESEPNFDTKDKLTIENKLKGLTRPENIIYTLIPPDTPPGQYGIRLLSPWIWQKYLNLYVFNNDSITHTCLGYEYYIAVSREARRFGIRPLEEGER